MPNSKNSEVWAAAAAVYASGKGMNAISAPTKTYTVPCWFREKRRLLPMARNTSALRSMRVNGMMAKAAVAITLVGVFWKKRSVKNWAPKKTAMLLAMESRNTRESTARYKARLARFASLSRAISRTKTVSRPQRLTVEPISTTVKATS